ncbi:MAG: hypothetical protein ACRCRQ_01620 [Metamycoplasmataceae bacterium]
MKNKQVITKIVLPIKNKSIRPMLAPGKRGWSKKLLNKIMSPYFQPHTRNPIVINAIPKSNLKNDEPKMKIVILEIVALINDKDSIKAENTNEKKIDLFLTSIMLDPWFFL